MMNLYEEAITRARVAHMGEDGYYKTIPEELLAIHPKALYQEMPQILADCEAIQKMVLEEILYLAKDSAYAQDQGFAGIHDLAGWQAKAVVSGYGDYQRYIEAEMHCESEQLFSGKTAMYIATTGSTGKIKYFVESEAGNAAKQLIMAIRGMYMSDCLPVTLDMEAKNLTISNYATMGESDQGKLIVRASGQTARNMRKKTGTMNILPVTFWESPGITATDRDYMIAVYALADQRLAKIFCNNLAHFGRLLDRIAQEGAQMIADIRQGNFSVPLLPEVREKLAETFQADEIRADSLQAIYDGNQCLIAGAEDIAAIWPSLSMVGCWLSGGVGRDAREVLRRLPANIDCFDLGYGASEGKLNIPTKLGTPSGVAAPFACFYEFLPLGESKPLCLWEVEDGAYYELLITTYSGLYRYNLQDIVRIDGFTGKTPNMMFCGKSSEFIWVNGQKCYGHQFMEIIQQAEKSLEKMLCLAQVFGQGAGFCFVLEAEGDFDAKAMKAVLDTLSAAAFGVISSGLYVMHRGYKDHLFTEYTKDDRGVCGIKLPMVLANAPEELVAQIVI